jgi:pantoate--beta-alanine ligase
VISMKVLKSPEALSRILSGLRKKRKRIGFVPTMGFLHEGHVSLVRRACRETDVVIVSIFVNPTQFGPREDFDRYGRDLKRDVKLLRKVHVDYVFAPRRNAVYPDGFSEFIEPGPLARYLCGPKRPGHFRGVATVVKRLFDLVQPHVAYFGAKDYQQARVIEALVRRFKLPVRIKIGATVRELDGLAMSSRNRQLSELERLRARTLYLALLKSKRLIAEGERDVTAIKKAARDLLQRAVRKVDYFEVSDPQSLKPLKRVGRNNLIAVACFLGRTRLIDNMIARR